MEKMKKPKNEKTKMAVLVYQTHQITKKWPRANTGLIYGDLHLVHSRDKSTKVPYIRTKYQNILKIRQMRNIHNQLLKHMKYRKYNKNVYIFLKKLIKNVTFFLNAYYNI